METAGPATNVAEAAMTRAARWVVRGAIAVSVMAVLTSVAMIWLYLTNPIEVAHVVNDGVAATAGRLAALVAATIVRAVRLL
jgi:hypothetical protein